MWNWLNDRGEQGNDESGAPEVQALLRDLASKRAEPSPFFAKRVMAAIEAREAELVRRARAWAVVPSFASRLSAVAALLLVMASTWLWTGTHGKPAVTTGLVEDIATSGSQTNQDDVFVSPSEDAR
jgi:type VI protein secretion system component VasK